MSEFAFSIESLLGADIYPHKFQFVDGAFKGLEIKFRSLPKDAFAIVEAAIGEKLKALGFTDPKPTVLHLVGQLPLTGDEYQAYEDAFDKLTASGKQELADVVLEGLHAVVVKIVGSWNAKESIEHLPALLEKFPELTRAVFALASDVTLSTEKVASLKK